MLNYVEGYFGFQELYKSYTMNGIVLQSSNWKFPLGDAAILPIHQDWVICHCVITIFQRMEVMI